MPSKNVLFLCRLFHPHVGGVEKHVEKISQELMSRGYRITIVTEQYSLDLPLTETLGKIKIIRIPHAALHSKMKLWFWVFRNSNLFFQADLIHIHDVFWWILPLSVFLPNKSFMTFHGYEGSEAPKANQIFWHRLAALMTSGNMCIGGFHQKWYGVKPTITSFGATDFVKVMNVKKKEHTIIFAGRLAEDTGIMTYLEGFEKLYRKNPKWRLDVFGEGPQENVAKSFVLKHQLPVKFFGFKKDVTSILSQYSVAFISRYLGILESLSSHTPIIAHYNNEIKKDYLQLSSFAEWIGIVSTAEEVATAVEKIEPVSSQAQKWVRLQTWSKMVDDYERLWGKA